MSNSRKIATEILFKIYQNFDIEKSTKLNKNFQSLDSRDKSFVKSILLNSLRRHSEIDQIISQFLKKPLPKEKQFIMNLLRVSICQIIFLDVTEYAAVNSAVEISKKYKFEKLVNALLRNVCRKKEDIIKNLKIDTNIPEWLRKDILKFFGKKKFLEISKQITKEPYLDLNFKENTFKKKNWSKIFNGKVILNDMIRLKNEGQVEKLPFFQNGSWWVQGVAASLPVRLINNFFKNKTKKNISVLDIGAAPGGKTFQLLDKHYNLTSLEISPKRIQRLKDNLIRLNLKTKIIQADILDWKKKELFDCILLDAPCSASGLIQKKPEILIKNKLLELKNLIKKQELMLNKSISFLKKGGILVYSVCSIHSEEGVNQIKKFLNTNKNYSLVNTNFFDRNLGGNYNDGMFISTPADFINYGSIDGFFIACLKRF